MPALFFMLVVALCATRHAIHIVCFHLVVPTVECDNPDAPLHWQVMSATMLLGGGMVVLFRVAHSDSVGDWRGPGIAAGTSLAMGMSAALALRAANNFQMQSVRCAHSCQQ